MAINNDKPDPRDGDSGNFTGYPTQRQMKYAPPTKRGPDINTCGIGKPIVPDKLGDRPVVMPGPWRR
jgi:hypothetical protein